MNHADTLCALLGNWSRLFPASFGHFRRAFCFYQNLSEIFKKVKFTEVVMFNKLNWEGSRNILWIKWLIWAYAVGLR